jgi:hypothetical protein
MSDQRLLDLEKQLVAVVGEFRDTLRNDLTALSLRMEPNSFRRELIRIISVKRGNVSSSQLPSLKNFIELTERDIAIQLLDRMESGLHL